MSSRQAVAALMLVGALGVLPEAHGQSVWDRAKQKAKDKAGISDTSTSTDTNAQPQTTSAAPAADANAAPEQSAAPADVGTAQAATPSIRSYQNYDFVPGETILFADDFANTQDGEFPNQWELKKGQAVVNKQAGFPALLLTDGNYATVGPRMKQTSYLGPQWTLEFDTFGVPGSNPPVLLFGGIDGEATLTFSASEAQYYTGNDGGVSLNGTYPPAIEGEAYTGKWHHVAIAYKQPQMKVYIDQFRVLTVPDAHYQAPDFYVAGIGDQQNPIVYRNVRLASGGGMNLLGQKFTDAKIVTHGINFDVDRATIRPESMDVLNQIKSVLVSDPGLKFEIDGHTDNSGNAAHNQQLSQQRADAVKAQLVAMGVDGSRLTTKGFGDTKPVGPNATPEGKANNRRVEFVRM